MLHKTECLAASGNAKIFGKIQKRMPVLKSREKEGMQMKRKSEEELVKRKIDWIDAEIKAGKRKLLNSKQALGKYAKYLKPSH